MPVQRNTPQVTNKDNVDGELIADLMPLLVLVRTAKPYIADDTAAVPHQVWLGLENDELKISSDDAVYS